MREKRLPQHAAAEGSSFCATNAGAGVARSGTGVPAALHLASSHLSEDQLEDALLGDLAGHSASAHLSACPECQQKIAEARAALHSFNTVSLAWSERRSATLVQPPAQAGRAVPPGAAWVSAALLGCAVAFAWPLAHRSVSKMVVSSPAPSLANMPSAAGEPSSILANNVPGDGRPAGENTTASDRQIASDNQLLAAIDRELEPDGPPGLLLQGTAAAEPHRAPRRSSAAGQDREPLT